jgi:hypothetical protein
MRVGRVLDDPAPDRLVPAYEALRRQRLDAVDIAARGPGLGLLIHRGMSVWMESYARELSASASERRVAPTPAPLRAEVLRDEVVLVLTRLLRAHVAWRV